MPPAVDGRGVADASEPALIADGDLAHHVAHGTRGKSGSRQRKAGCGDAGGSAKESAARKGHACSRFRYEAGYMPYRRLCLMPSGPRVSRCVVAHERKSNPSDPARPLGRTHRSHEIGESTPTARKRAVTLQHEAAPRFRSSARPPLARGSVGIVATTAGSWSLRYAGRSCRLKRGRHSMIGNRATTSRSPMAAMETPGCATWSKGRAGKPSTKPLTAPQSMP
jgi:hypothetical protein